MTVEKLFDDDRADAIFWRIYRTEDREFRPERDADLFNEIVAELVALGYSAEDAKRFLTENLAECDPE
jgi:hypothetical protein